MTEYVTKEKVLAQLERCARDPYHESHYIREAVINTIRRMEAADVAPVVRCKDCRWWDKEREQCGITPSSSPYGHCHDGEILEHSMIKDAGR